MAEFDKLTPPADGQPITVDGNDLVVPNNPIIPVIEGDGIGPDIMRPTRKVLDAAVEKAYGGQRRLVWFDIYAGDSGQEMYGDVLPADTLRAIETYIVALKGPLTTPVGGGYRSLNVALRQKLNLYACVRPVRYFAGVPSPVARPERMDIVIYRENTEDVYAGIEWQEGTPEAEKVIRFLRDEMGVHIRPDSGIGIKPISETGSKQLVRKAIQYGIQQSRPSVTLVHKGNIMKYTEGAFADWGYEVARDEFGEQTITEAEVYEKHDGVAPDGRVVIKDRIADSMFQQILTRTDEYDVIALPNLNGDYLSDAAAAQIGGLGLAPGANMGDHLCLCEATHGTAPKYAGKDVVNPGSLMLSGVLMLDYLGWQEAGALVTNGIAASIRQQRVTYDLARLMGDVKPIHTSEFGDAVIENLGA